MMSNEKHHDAWLASEAAPQTAENPSRPWRTFAARRFSYRPATRGLRQLLRPHHAETCLTCHDSGLRRCLKPLNLQVIGFEAREIGSDAHEDDGGAVRDKPSRDELLPGQHASRVHVPADVGADGHDA